MKDIYAIVPTFTGNNVVKTRIIEAVGDRVRVDYPGNPVLDGDMVFGSYLDGLRRLLQLHDEGAEKERKRILERIRREMKKEKVTK